MTYKIVKNASGKVVGFGPNEDFYEPAVPDGCTLEITEVEPIDPQMVAEQAQRQLTQAVQQHLDVTAQSLGYDDIRSASTYADEPAVAKFQNEGRALRAWRSLLWDVAYAKMQRVKSGLEPVPTAEVLIASLPAFMPPQ
jgi:hypothetical protein